MSATRIAARRRCARPSRSDPSPNFFLSVQPIGSVDIMTQAGPACDSLRWSVVLAPLGASGPAGREMPCTGFLRDSDDSTSGAGGRRLVASAVRNDLVSGRRAAPPPARQNCDEVGR